MFWCLTSVCYVSSIDAKEADEYDVIFSGWAVSICLVGALFGCFFSGTLADELGRRRSAQLSTLPIIIGTSLRWLFQTSSPFCSCVYILSAMKMSSNIFIWGLWQCFSSGFLVHDCGPLLSGTWPWHWCTCICSICFRGRYNTNGFCFL